MVPASQMKDFSSLLKQVQLLEKLCHDTKPQHRVAIDVGQRTLFKPGKLLDTLKKYYVGKEGDPLPLDRRPPLPPQIQSILESLPWFRQWLSELCDKRRKRTYDEAHELRCLIRQYPHSRPLNTDVVYVYDCPQTLPTSPNSESLLRYTTSVKSVFEKVSECLFDTSSSSSSIPSDVVTLFHSLPWAKSYVSNGLRRRIASKMRSVINKSMKIECILFFFRDRKPKWGEVVHISIPGEVGKTFPFHVASFLDDCVGSLVLESKMQSSTYPSSVSSSASSSSFLTRSQSIALIKHTSWVANWIEKILTQRRVKEVKEALFREDEDEEYDDEDDDGHRRMMSRAKRQKVRVVSDSETE